MANEGTSGRLVRRRTFYTSAVLALLVVACVPASRRLPAALPEVSGAAILDDGTLVALNDGGNPALVYSVGLVGGDSAAAFLRLPENEDWEALAFDPQRDRLAICDVGDNRRSRQSLTVTVVSLADRRMTTYELAYPDRPHDCEACLLRGDSLTLITKAQTLRGGRTRTAYVYVADLRTDRRLALRDSFTLRRRSVTDATYVSPDTLAVLAYDYRFLGPAPLSKTSVFIGTWADFRQNRARRLPVRAPFALTQYEAIADPRDGARRLLIASERTPLSPQHYRCVRY